MKLISRILIKDSETLASINCFKKSINKLRGVSMFNELQLSGIGGMGGNDKLYYQQVTEV